MLCDERRPPAAVERGKRKVLWICFEKKLEVSDEMQTISVCHRMATLSRECILDMVSIFVCSTVLGVHYFHGFNPGIFSVVT